MAGMDRLCADANRVRFELGRWARLLAAGLLFLVGLPSAASGQVALPKVAVHDSELTRALESMSLTNGPTGAGTTNKQWWTTDWRYFVMPESVKEALRSDGTPFTFVGDSNILAGVLLTNGAPRYPILISLASEAIHDDEIAALTNYVAKGGFLFMGSSAFTRTTNGTSRGDFAFTNALGLRMVTHGLTNWVSNNTLAVTNQTNHILISHFPSGELTNRMPASSEEISWGTSPSHPFLAAHDLWKVQTTGATVLAVGDDYPLLCDELVKLGLPVSDDLPKEVLQLMELYPQAGARRPSVEYIPLPYPQPSTPPARGNRDKNS